VYKLLPQANQSKGFTLIELALIIVILGILASSALPKFFELSGYQQRGFFDDTLNAIRYAQKLAVATGCNVQFSIASNQYTLKRPGASDRSLCSSSTASDFTQVVSRPGSGESSYQGSQSGVSISNTTLYFNAQGTASTNATITLANRQITVVRNTGFVYDSTP
jgi:MSHA pilin protein MshC